MIRPESVRRLLGSLLNETICASAIGFGRAERSFTGIACMYRSSIWRLIPAMTEWIMLDDHASLIADVERGASLGSRTGGICDGQQDHSVPVV